jgi:hypothetical protein
MGLSDPVREARRRPSAQWRLSLTKSSGKQRGRTMVFTLIKVAAVAGIAAVVIAALPDIKRYVAMSTI